MLLVVFGAGASYDSVPHFAPHLASGLGVEPIRPPLANQLFGDRPIFLEVMQQFRECMEIVPWLRKRGVSVEGELAMLQAQALTFPRVHQELAAIRYYLHVALWSCQNEWAARHRGITNYAVLLREIERWRYASSESVCFVTFNYDTMLEEAMRQVLSLEISDLKSYLQKTYSLVKLHGSINWGREIDIAEPQTYNPQRLIREAATLQISDRYVLAAHRPMLREGKAQRLVFPALSIPVERKDEFNCPSEHVQRLKEVLPKVTRIITVGWRATEKDFIDLLRKELTEKPSLMVVSGDANGAKETISNLGIELPGRYPTNSNPQPMTATVLIETGFTGFVLDEVDRLGKFLR